MRGNFKGARVSQSVCREEAKWEVEGVQVARYFVSRTLFGDFRSQQLNRQRQGKEQARQKPCGSLHWECFVD